MCEEPIVFVCISILHLSTFTVTIIVAEEAVTCYFMPWALCVCIATAMWEMHKQNITGGH